MDFKTQKQKLDDSDKKIQLWVDIIQDVINITSIYLLWVHVHPIISVIVGLYEFIRIGAYFKLGEKASQKVQETYYDVLLGKK